MAEYRMTASDGAQAGAVAWACAQLGMRVFPLRTPGGTPALTAWPERATRDEAQLIEWWTGEYAGHGVGVATGPESGVWVLDIDVKDADGFASLRELTYAHEQTSAVFTRTMVVRTPSGGAHVYFRWDETASAEGGVRNSSKQLAPGLDVRGVRGYVRAAGNPGYRCVRGSTRIADAPAWLVELTRRRRVSAGASPGARRPQPGGAFARAQAQRVLDALGRAAPGTRNDALNRAAFMLGISGAVSEDEAWRACRTVMYSVGANDPVQAQRRTFDSGWSAGVTSASGKCRH